MEVSNVKLKWSRSQFTVSELNTSAQYIQYTQYTQYIQYTQSPTCFFNVFTVHWNLCT